MQPGARVGPYEIVGLLGAGGMGEVYSALDPRLCRRIALKILPESLAANPERRERFEREAQAIAALSHTNIVTIHSVEEAGGSTGGRGECGAWRGIVHRDLKPGIVLVGDDGRLKVLDFGLAKLTSSAKATSAASASKAVDDTTMGASTVAPLVRGGQPLTARGSIVGPPHYMSRATHTMK